MQSATESSLPDAPFQGESQSDSHDLPIVVIGAGPVGLRTAEELVRQIGESRIEIFGNEPWALHNRVKLSSYLAGEVAHEEMEGTFKLADNSNIQTHINEAVTDINPDTKSVTTRYGNVLHYRFLVIATGSQPFVPCIPGVGLQGVYTFRDMTDTHRLFARKARSRHTLVIGGGLLGLESAKAMRRFNTRVTVVEHNAHLMFRQLDRRGSRILQQHVESLGINVITNQSVRQILGTLHVQGVELCSGQTLRCDTVILAAGVSPNIDLAKEAGLKTNRGILVNDRLQTSDPSIFAVGECVEHRGEVYGLVDPGYEQAAVAACAIAGKPAVYRGPLSVTSLKVVGYPVCSIGDVRECDRQRQGSYFKDETIGVYRQLIIDRGRLIGVIALGEWHEIPRLREMIYNRRRIKPWQLWRFRSSGMLWRNRDTENLFE